MKRFLDFIMFLFMTFVIICGLSECSSGYSVKASEELSITETLNSLD